jgi:mevalonate kinase
VENELEEKDQTKEMLLIDDVWRWICEVYQENDKHSYSIHIELSSEIPISAGMGSSASYSVSLCASLIIAFLHVFGYEIELNDYLDKISFYANYMETMIHTKPSGVDVQIVMKGGLMLFQKDVKAGTVSTKQFHAEKSNFNFMVVNTNKQRKGRETIEKVLRLSTEEPETFKEAMGQLGDITSSIVECLGLESEEKVTVDQFELMDLVSMNQ